MASLLILAPTPLEFEQLRPQLATSLSSADSAIALCGFGVAAAGARTAQLIAQHEPQEVVLIGVAGALDEQAKVGAAYSFDEVVIYGIGAGSGEQHLCASEMGWPLWSGEAAGSASESVPIGQVISLESGSFAETSRQRQLLTACAASANEDDVNLRRRKYPDAAAEDMEGFAVAIACRLAGVPLRIIRGISNRAGDCDKENWRIEEALHAAARLLDNAIV